MTLVHSPTSFLVSPPSHPQSFPTSASSRSSLPSPSSPLVKSIQGLLVPTDRPLEELEEKWLPRLGKLKVDREVVLPGYSLYLLRSWFLSRTHWTQTIVTQTGKPTEHITAYVLIPDPQLSVNVGKLELDTATQLLASETKSIPRKTEYGTLLVTTPSAFGQDVSSITAGDLRVARPYITLATGLRRLGCGGRAAIGMEFPVPAIRRKFYDLYRVPFPSSSSTSQAPSPTGSPTTAQSSPNPLHSGVHIENEPFYLSVIELIKLIQGALAIWGLFATERDDLEMNGLFCDETKAGIFRWRSLMGMDTEDSLKLEKETSGGCIDPKTLSALLSSVTSVHYQLDALGVEKIPKDPFTHVRRFLNVWEGYQIGLGRTSNNPRYLSVSAIRHLRTQYHNERTRPTDAFKAPLNFLSGVAHATSSLSANLKGQDDLSLRRREHRVRSPDDDERLGGMQLIVPEGQVGHSAPPDVITTDLEAYTRSLIKTKEKDWGLLGARRIAELWNGSFTEHDHKKRNGFDRVFRQRQASKLISDDDGETSGGGTRGALKGLSNRTGQAIKESLSLVGRRGGETSDSEPGGGGSSSMRHVLSKSRQSTVPTVIEPRSPSPFIARRSTLDLPNGSLRPSFQNGTSRAGSKRPSLSTALSNDGSDMMSRRSYATMATDGRSPDERWDMERAKVLGLSRSLSSRAAFHARGRALHRTASDGADVKVGKDGNEWEVVNPHGRGKREMISVEDGEVARLKRRASLQNMSDYATVRLSPPEHLDIDVQLCGTVLELRQRERLLSRKAKEIKALEETVFAASQDVISAIQSRRQTLITLKAQYDQFQQALRQTLEGVDEDAQLQWASKKIQFYLSEDTNNYEVMWNLYALERDWEKARTETNGRRRVENGNQVKDTSEETKKRYVINEETPILNMNGGLDISQVKEKGKSWWRFGW
ncbi:hypothetical protein TREMEDRAFT_71084 [Tremella mesenterica DSM 1558]|uniref:uncharacterized protein n=1 Tax=Tremella mesenterica (strain ATCC 24925 / CBS 8224 / DSM 1558 / NBRC 9311 / NRRL Y-6157 / RJB 2259-6 / UBC 559-6) TaxID=578456 RepID=UPI0003F496AB|nr:uncharacterized protein TREMEDRAFT_71084 [Tremella mesenterica DSM 1558]EIW71183.1 hypothetical protein TREMEDRAFT_71084 [Tremella mesenterica DSM 1558]